MADAYIVIFGFVGVVAACVFSAKAGQFYERRRWEQRILKRAGVQADDAVDALPAAAHSRLDRLERAVDTIAGEVERVVEGQQFVTRLLSEPKAGRESR